MSQPPGADNELGNETGPRQRAAGTPRRGNWPRQPHAAACIRGASTARTVLALNSGTLSTQPHRGQRSIFNKKVLQL